MQHQRRHLCQVGIGAVAVGYPATGVSSLSHDSAAAGGRQSEVLYFDSGGPGAAPLDAGALRQGMPAWTRGYTLVTLAEPWTFRAADPHCERWMVAIGSTGEPTDAEASPAQVPCSWSDWRLGAEDVQESLPEIVRRFGPIAGVYASSFGAVRSLPVMRHLAAREEPGFLVMDAPAPTPNSTTGAELLQDRWDRAKRLITTAPKCSRACVDARAAELERFLQGTGQMSAFEAGLGMLALVPRLSANREFLADVWGHTQELSRVQVLTWKRVARGYNMSNSAGAPRPELVSYLASICMAYRGWDFDQDNPLTAMHALCGDSGAGIADNAGEPVREPKAAAMSVPTFIAVNESDPVLSSAQQQSWAELLPNSVQLTYQSLIHGTGPARVDGAIGRWLDATLGQ
ncbi:MAG: hypothetical protein ACRCYU_18895 [Nocardioides sp.]